MYEIRIILTVLTVLICFGFATGDEPFDGVLAILFMALAFNISPWQPWF